MKSRVLFQLNHLGYGGTEKAILTFCRNIDRTRFEPILFYFSDKGTPRYYGRKIISLFSPRHKKSFIQKYKTYFARLAEFEETLGAENVHCGVGIDFIALLKSTKPHVLHISRGDEVEFYTKLADQIPQNIAVFETSIFGKSSPKNYLDKVQKIGFISQWLFDKSTWKGDKGVVMYNPILRPKTDENLRAKLNIAADAIVLGRISRPNLDQGDFILEAYKSLNRPDVVLLVLAASAQFREQAKVFQNIRCLPPTLDEEELSRFYNSLDLLLHYRREGETFGMNIAEAMIHGKPVISHYSSVDNAQIELLEDGPFGPAGLVVAEDDRVAYVEAVQTLLVDKGLRLALGQNGKRKAETLFAEDTWARKVEGYYLEMVSA